MKTRFSRREFSLGSLAAGTALASAGRGARAQAAPVKIRVGWVVVPASLAPLILEKKDTVAQALTKFRTSRADFADCLIERCGRSAGCQHVLTFDKNAAASGMRLLSS